MFEKRVLRRTFRPKREKVAGGCRRLHNEELHKLYASPDIKVNCPRPSHLRWKRRDKTHKILVGKPESNRPLRKPMRR
jgi:hypothetical protein